MICGLLVILPSPQRISWHRLTLGVKVAQRVGRARFTLGGKHRQFAGGASRVGSHAPAECLHFSEPHLCLQAALIGRLAIVL
ncbi:hypothetical protein D9M68_392210 [compost metagenome]